ncbi:hypothetical protein [Saccharothrix longispora]|uniref:hypothetical protein n=1 Tax=Saccharothrix longispora TaxID=33920 RepID=UPI0028FD28BC|nr:hypothetical protein [Saccharothrix longispora]MDU0293868.1 hypothetical protein [Saccharothrix longispora]
MWLSEPRARHVHAACGSTGRVFAVASVVLATAIVLLGLRLPTAYHPVNTMAWIIGGASVLTVLYAALGLMGVRSYLRDGYLDAAGARRTTRLLAAMWATAVVFSSLACFLFFGTVVSQVGDPLHPEVRFTVAVWAQLCLLAAPPVLTGVLFFVGRRLLDPVPPAVRQDAAVSPAAGGPGFATYPLPPPPQRHVWMPAARAHEVRRACGRLGTALLIAGVLLAPMVVLLGDLLPPLYPALGFLSWTFTATGMVQVFIAATVLRGARRHVTGEYLDLPGALTTRRSLGVIWGLGLLFAVFSGVGLVVGLSSATGGPAGEAVRYPAVAWVVLSLMAMPGVLTGVAFFAARRLFAPLPLARS